MRKLIKELVNKNIGRPATYADLLSKITNRNYVEKKGNVYHATDLGKKVTDILNKFFTFMDYNYTADLESKLDLIENGKVDKVEMLSNFYKKFSDEIYKSYSENIKQSHKCKKCKHFMVERQGKFGKFYSCVNVSCRNVENINNAS